MDAQSGTDFLFVEPSFTRGCARVADFWGGLTRYNPSRDGAEADARALRADFAAVGEDLRSAAREVICQRGVNTPPSLIAHIRRPVSRRLGSSFYRDTRPRSAATLCGANVTQYDSDLRTKGIPWVGSDGRVFVICEACLSLRDARKGAA